MYYYSWVSTYKTAATEILSAIIISISRAILLGHDNVFADLLLSTHCLVYYNKHLLDFVKKGEIKKQTSIFEITSLLIG